MTETIIYVVEGSTGEYSDNRNWAVCAYRDEDEAKAHVERAERRAAEIFATCAGDYWAWRSKMFRDEERPMNEHDPAMDLDYTGTHYTYYPVKLYE